MKKTSLFLIFLVVVIGSLSGQIVQPGTADEDLLRFDQLENGKSLYNTPSVFYTKDSIEFIDFSNKKFSILPIYSTSAFNSAYARSMNNGPLWYGKGLTQAVSWGTQFDGEYLKVTLNPVVYYSQNSSFFLPEGDISSQYNYQFLVENRKNGLDWVQRYGNEAFVFFHMGQSEIAFNYKKVGLTVTTQNYTTGPARFYPIVQSKNGVGFPRVEFGTVSPVKLKIGKVELGSFEIRGEYGYLVASEYADDSDENFDRFLAGLNLEYTVPYLNGLKLGLIKTAIKNMDDFEWYDLLAPIYRVDQDDFDDLVSNDNYDQMASAYIDWYLSESNLRMYFVYSKNDFFYNPGQLLQELEHSAGHVIGLEKIFELEKGRLHLAIEQTNIIRSTSYMHRPTPPYYVHSIVKQGYTHQGQMLGAGFGSGGAAETLAFNYYSKKGQMIGFKAERIRYNEDYFNAVLDIPWEDEKEEYHDVEYTFSIDYRKSFHKLTINAEVGYSHRFNMYFDRNNDVDNLFLGVHAAWRIID